MITGKGKREILYDDLRISGAEGLSPHSQEQGLGVTPNHSLNPGRDGDPCQSTAVTPAGQFNQAWKPSSQHAEEKRGVAGLLLGRTVNWPAGVTAVD